MWADPTHVTFEEARHDDAAVLDEERRLRLGRAPAHGVLHARRARTSAGLSRLVAHWPALRYTGNLLSLLGAGSSVCICMTACYI
jgi:hypothetical protein